MPIVLITESLLLRNKATDGRILRDRMLSGCCVRMNLGYWPLMTVVIGADSASCR